MATTQKNSWLQGIRARVGNIEVFSDEDGVGVKRDIEQAHEDDDVGSPVAESIKDARVNLQESQHQTDFDLYDAMMDIDPELSGAVNAIAQTASQFEVVPPVDEPDERGETALEECNQLVYNLDGDVVSIDILRNIVKYGNDINKKVYNEEDGIRNLQSLPMNSMTIVDDRSTIYTAEPSAGIIGDDFESLLNSVTQQDEDGQPVERADEVDEVFSTDAYVLNEATDDFSIIEPDDVLHFNIDARSNWFTDKHGRDTYGVWGKSRLEPLKFTIQTKYNTLTNKVAMDDKLLAREIYYIDTTELFGDISDFEERKKKAESYAKDIASMIEGLGPDERPILPDQVDVDIVGPEGAAIDQKPFLEQLNNAIAAALTFPMAGLGRGTTAVRAGEEIASLWAQNNIRNLRQSLIRGWEELFEDHLALLHPEWVENPDATELGERRLEEDVQVPTLKYEPFREQDMTEKARQIKLLYETKTMSRPERREHFGLPTDQESVERASEEFEEKAEPQSGEGQQPQPEPAGGSEGGPPIEDSDDGENPEQEDEDGE